MKKVVLVTLQAVELLDVRRVFKEEIQKFLQVGIRFAFDFIVKLHSIQMFIGPCGA